MINKAVLKSGELKAIFKNETSMIVCLCAAASEQDIRRHIADGARTVDEVASRCRAGASCGACRGYIAEMIEAEAGEKRRALPVLAPA